MKQFTILSIFVVGFVLGGMAVFPEKVLASWICGTGIRTWDFGYTVGNGLGICSSGAVITEARMCTENIIISCEDGTFDPITEAHVNQQCVPLGAGTVGECVPSSLSSQMACSDCGGGISITGDPVGGRVFYDHNRDGNWDKTSEELFYSAGVGCTSYDGVAPQNYPSGNAQLKLFGLRVLVSGNEPIKIANCYRGGLPRSGPAYNTFPRRYNEGETIVATVLPPLGWECTAGCSRSETMPGNSLFMDAIGIADAFPDYVITQTSLSPISPHSGQVISFNARVNNVGAEDAQDSSDTQVCIDDNADTVCDYVLTTGTSALPAKGGSEVGAWSWSGGAAGNYQYKVCADTGNDINEGTGEGNNCSNFIPFSVTSSLSCSPASQSVAQNTDAVFTAQGGTGGYTWSASPSSGATSSVIPPNQFRIRYLPAGTNPKTITLRDSSLQTVTCSLTVNAGVSSATGIVFEDWDKNSLFSPGDRLLQNERVHLRSGDGTVESGTISPDTTDATGHYVFNSIQTVQGTYCANREPVTNNCYRVAYDTPSDSTPSPGTGAFKTFGPSGAQNFSWDFGIIRIPQAPTNASSTPTCSYVDITWTDNDGNEQYFGVHRSTASGFSPDATNLVANVNSLPSTGGTGSYRDTTVGAGDYYYKIVSYLQNGDKAPSLQASAVVPVCPGANDTALEVALSADPWVVDIDKILGYATVTLNTTVFDPDGDNSPYTYTYDCDGNGQTGIGRVNGPNPVMDDLTNSIECRFYDRGTFVPTVNVTRPGAAPNNNDAFLVIVKPPLPIYKETSAPISLKSFLALSRDFLRYY